MNRSFAIVLHDAWSRKWVRFLVAIAVIVGMRLESLSARNDLDIFLAAAVDLFNGINIYTQTYFDGYHYYYSVFFATLMRPLAELSSSESKFLWIALNVILLFRILKICLHFLWPSAWKPELKTLYTFLLIVFCIRFFRDNLHLCQMTILMLYLSLEAVYCVFNKKPLLGALLLSLAINIKLLPIVLIPYFLYRREWKTVFYTLILLLVFYELPSLWIGSEHNHFLLGEWMNLIHPLQQKHLLDVEETSFHGLTTLMATLFIKDLNELHGLHIKRNIGDLTLEQLYFVINIVRLLLVAFTLWFLRTAPFKSFVSKEKTWWEISYLLLVVPLIFPHQQHYAFLMCLPAIAWVILWLMKEKALDRSHCCMKLGMMLIFFAFNLNLLLGSLTAYYNHFKIVTYGAIILMIILAYARPKEQHKIVSLR